MPNPLTFSLKDYPNLSKLINGQEVTLKIKVRALNKMLTSQGEYISLQPDMMDIDEGVKPTTQEILLASIAQSLQKQPIATP